MKEGQVVFNDLTISERITLLTSKTEKPRELIGLELGMTSRNIARYIRCNQLIPEFVEMLDNGTLTMIVGVEISFLTREEQRLVLQVMEQNCITLGIDTAKKIRKEAGSITLEILQTMFGLNEPVEPLNRSVNVRLPASVYRKYFADTAAKDVHNILEDALKLYYENSRHSSVYTAE